jgi:acid phosphatase type 7
LAALRPLLVAALLLTGLALGGLDCASASDQSGTTAGPSAPAGTSGSAARVKGRGGRVVVVAAGDISCAGVCGQKATARLVSRVRPNAVLGLGDFQYETGTKSNLDRYYDPYWGGFKSKTYAINGGRHDFYGTGDWLDYFNRGGPMHLRPEGSYSFDLGRWHVVALNSYCFERSSCDASGWTRWLRQDLARHRARCTLAFWHEPYWTSPSHHEEDKSLTPWVKALYQAGADVLLQAHNHAYERFAPQDPSGHRDDARGIRGFTVGTGGDSHYDYMGTVTNSAVKNDNTYGVLKLTLRPRGYDWRFLPVAGKSFSDSGAGRCHG